MCEQFDLITFTFLLTYMGSLGGSQLHIGLIFSP